MENRRKVRKLSRGESLAVLFNGDAALTPAERECVKQYRLLLNQLFPGFLAREAQIRQLLTMINETLRRQFRSQAIAQWFAPRIEEIRRCVQKELILEAFIVFVDHGFANEGAKPKYEEGRIDRFCDTLRAMIADPNCQSVAGLVAYLQNLLANNCP